MVGNLRATSADHPPEAVWYSSILHGDLAARERAPAALSCDRPGETTCNLSLRKKVLPALLDRATQGPGCRTVLEPSLRLKFSFPAIPSSALDLQLSRERDGGLWRREFEGLFRHAVFRQMSLSAHTPASNVYASDAVLSVVLDSLHQADPSRPGTLHCCCSILFSSALSQSVF